MPSTNPFNFTKNRNRKLTYAVKRFNAKLTRLIKKNPELEKFYPERQYVSKIKPRILTVEDFNYELRRLNNFLKKGQEEIIVNKVGTPSTRWEIHETRIGANRVNKRNAELELKDKATGIVKTDIERANFNPIKFDFENKSPTAWKKFVASVEKQASGAYRASLVTNYKEDYLSNLEEHLSSAMIYDKLVELIKSIPEDVLYGAFYVDPALNIRFISDPLEVDLIAETIYNKWIWYLNKINENNGKGEEVNG